MLPSTPTPSRVGVSSSHPRSLPTTSVSANASRSARSSAGVSIRRSGTLELRNQPTGSMGSHARAVVTTYGYPAHILAVVASVQAESAPETWSHVLSQRIDGCTPEFIAALVRAMRTDLALSQSQA